MPSYLQLIRQRVSHEKIILVYASACIRDNAGRLLWQRRSDFGWWGLPGGILELEESLPGCIIREVKEETGLEVEPVRVIGIYSSPDFDVTYPNGDQVQQLTVCFECRMIGGKLKIDHHETLELAWHPLEDPPDTSLWYKMMVDDLALNLKAAIFDRGSQGSRTYKETYFSHLSGRIGKTTMIMPLATAFIQDETGKLLLKKRGIGDEWELPFFRMELGERIDQTLVRGILKETGLKVQAKKLIGIYSEGWKIREIGEIKKNKLLHILFQCHAFEANGKMKAMRSDPYRFFRLATLPPVSSLHFRFLHDGLSYRKEPVF